MRACPPDAVGCSDVAIFPFPVVETVIVALIVIATVIAIVLVARRR